MFRLREKASFLPTDRKRQADTLSNDHKLADALRQVCSPDLCLSVGTLSGQLASGLLEGTWMLLSPRLPVEQRQGG